MEIRVQVSGIYSYNYESLSFYKEKGLAELHLDTILKIQRKQRHSISNCCGKTALPNLYETLSISQTCINGVLTCSNKDKQHFIY